MRKYQAIWEQVKSDPSLSASLLAPKVSHTLIIRAVRKEKNKDLGYKLTCSEAKPPVKYKLMEEITGREIRFYLEDISPISTDDL